MDRQAGDILAVNQNGAAIELQLAGDGIEKARFAGAVGADDDAEIALVQDQVDAGQGTPLVRRAGMEGLGRAPNLKHGRQQAAEPGGSSGSGCYRPVYSTKQPQSIRSAGTSLP